MAENTAQLEAELAELRNELAELKKNSLTKEEVRSMFPDLISHITTPVFISGSGVLHFTGKNEIRFFDKVSGKFLQAGALGASGNTLELSSGGASPSLIELSSNQIEFTLLDLTPAAAKIIFTAGGIIMDDLPTSDPSISGALWNNAGVMNIS